MLCSALNSLTTLYWLRVTAARKQRKQVYCHVLKGEWYIVLPSVWGGVGGGNDHGLVDPATPAITAPPPPSL